MECNADASDLALCEKGMPSHGSDLGGLGTFCPAHSGLAEMGDPPCAAPGLPSPWLAAPGLCSRAHFGVPGAGLGMKADFGALALGGICLDLRILVIDDGLNLGEIRPQPTGRFR